jgi:hypothetical protein
MPIHSGELRATDSGVSGSFSRFTRTRGTPSWLYLPRVSGSLRSSNPTPGVRSPQATALLKALGLFACWMAATYLFEGLPRTLLRPEATGLRLLYATLVNLGIGVLGAMWVARDLLRTSAVPEGAAGFGDIRRTAAGVAAGLLLGAALFMAQRPPAVTPAVLVNGFSQVLVVSTAEVLVCWSVVGATVETALQRRKVRLPRLGAGALSSALFGVYHFAHSPPFNSPRTVLLLAVVGLLTSAFFFSIRSAYGTILLHNFLGLYGVLDALARGGRIGGLERPSAALISTAVGTILLMAILQRLWLPSSRSSYGSFTPRQ